MLGGAYAVLFTDYLVYYFPQVTGWKHYLVSLTLIAVITWINVRGIQMVGQVATALEIFIFIPVIAMVVIALAKWQHNPFVLLIPPHQPTFKIFGVGLALGLWLYSGYEQLSTVAEEMADLRTVVTFTNNTVRTDSVGPEPRFGMVALTLDTADVPHVVYCTSGTSNQVMYTDKTGGTWKSPVTVFSGTNEMHPSMVTALDGTLQLAWLDNALASHAVIKYARYSLGAWSAAETVSAGDSLVLSNGDPTTFIRNPISAALLVTALVVLIGSLMRQAKPRVHAR